MIMRWRAEGGKGNVGLLIIPVAKVIRLYAARRVSCLQGRSISWSCPHPYLASLFCKDKASYLHDSWPVRFEGGDCAP
jgi:hypothetical protein